jgi:hypothetical protein
MVPSVNCPIYLQENVKMTPKTTIFAIGRKLVDDKSIHPIFSFRLFYIGISDPAPKQRIRA